MPPARTLSGTNQDMQETVRLWIRTEKINLITWLIMIDKPSIGVSNDLCKLPMVGGCKTRGLYYSSLWTLTMQWPGQFYWKLIVSSRPASRGMVVRTCQFRYYSTLAVEYRGYLWWFDYGARLRWCSTIGKIRERQRVIWDVRRAQTDLTSRRCLQPDSESSLVFRSWMCRVRDMCSCRGSSWHIYLCNYHGTLRRATWEILFNRRQITNRPRASFWESI